MQTRTISFVEVVLSTFIGLGIAVATQVIIFPWFNLRADLIQNLQIASIFTVVSIIRSYGVRRLFNWLEKGWLHS